MVFASVAAAVNSRHGGSDGAQAVCGEFHAHAPHDRLACALHFQNGARPRTMIEPAITREIIVKHGLTDEEYARIQGILGRDPNITELGVFSVMWSEHCSYKNTRRELRKFPTTGPLVLVKAGEDRGTVRPACDPSTIGDGWAVAFKMESHNHPSAIEPFQGAATGVGGNVAQCFQPVCIAV